MVSRLRPDNKLAKELQKARLNSVFKAVCRARRMASR